MQPKLGRSAKKLSHWLEEKHKYLFDYIFQVFDKNKLYLNIIRHLNIYLTNFNLIQISNIFLFNVGRYIN